MEDKEESSFVYCCLDTKLNGSCCVLVFKVVTLFIAVCKRTDIP